MTNQKPTRKRSKRHCRQIVRFMAASLIPIPVQPGDNQIFDECRHHWRGYQVHKIFGSARA